MEYFIQFVIENWYIEIPLIISIAALILFEKLKRAQRTGNLIMQELGEDIPTSENKALNERDYGDLSGLNKDDARKKWGDEQVHIWRRSYDTPPPGGESLKNTAERVLPYFENIIYPELRNQKDILISARDSILDEKLTFEDASIRYSDDQMSKFNGGKLINMNTGASKFELHELESDIKLAVEQLEVNEISLSEPSHIIFVRFNFKASFISSKTSLASEKFSDSSMKFFPLSTDSTTSLYTLSMFF